MVGFGTAVHSIFKVSVDLHAQPPLSSAAESSVFASVCSAVTALEAQQSALYGSSPVRLRPQRGFWSNALLNR